jgi:TRAP-type C4-dicarboxylate transport system substrate-binding protein
MNPIPTIAFSKFSEVQKYLTLTNHLFSPYTLMVNKGFYDGLTEAQQNILRYAADSCVTASRGISRVIEASDRGLAGLDGKIKITALSAEQRVEMAAVSQPAFEKHVTENLDAKAVELLAVFKAEVAKANDSQYLK